MDFLDPKKRRAHQRRLFIGYGLVAVAIGITSYLLLQMAGGLSYDTERHQVIQNGLVFVDAHPESARIYINGEDKRNTDARFVLEEGDYTVELKRDGYRSWKKSFTLEGGHVERLVYPFLFPQQLKRSDVQLYASTPDMTTQSPDRKWIVTHRMASFNTFELTDTTSDNSVTTTLTVSAAVLASKDESQKLTAVEWSTDNRHVLLRHTYAGGADYILLDRETPNESLNLTAVFGKSFDAITLRDKRPDDLYVWTAQGGVLQMADVQSKAVTAVASNVETFFPYGSDTLLLVNPGANAETRQVNLRKGSNTYPLRTLPKSERYLLNMAEFDGKQHVVAGASADSRAYVYQSPIDSLKHAPMAAPPLEAILRVPSDAEFVSFSTNARFIALQGKGSFAVYDAEAKRQHRYDTKLDLPAGQKATWMDGHRLTAVRNGKFVVFDFDNLNQQELQSVSPGQAVYFDRDYTAMFGVASSATVPDRTALVRTALVVK